MVLNSFPNNFFRQPSFEDLLSFGLFSIITVSILLWYYHKISKSETNLDELDNPIYQSKDILLQEKISDGMYYPSQVATSIWVKISVFILVILVAITPLYQLFGIQHFL